MQIPQTQREGRLMNLTVHRVSERRAGEEGGLRGALVTLG